MKKILGLDIGYSGPKVTYGYENGEIIQKFKFPSLIGLTKKLEHAADTKIKEYKGHYYYVGEDATHVASGNLIDITEYKNLEYYSPLLLQKALEIIGETPDIIVVGLSIAQIGNSGHFQEALSDFIIDGVQYKFPEVHVIPQGAGAKLCIDEFNDNFPVKQTEFLGATTYVIVDVGFQTLDLVLVKDGEAKASLFNGIEKEGVMKIAARIAKKVQDDFGRKITLGEARDVLMDGVYTLRGQKHDMKIFVQDVKKDYLKNMLKLVEDKYPEVLDKCKFISLSGGGAYLFNNGSTNDKFIRIPKNSAEYYNSIGQYLFGCKKCKG